MYQFPPWVLFSTMESNARARTPWTQAIAAQIRAERAASGMTQRQVIEASGLPKSTYLRLESGERVADADQLARFAMAVGVKLSVFFQRVEERAEHEAHDPITAQLEARLSPKGRDAVERGRRAVREQEAGNVDPPRLAEERTLRSA